MIDPLERWRRYGEKPDFAGPLSYGGAPLNDRPPICATCGVTMVPAGLSARQDHDGEWVCLECEELDRAE